VRGHPGRSSRTRGALRDQRGDRAGVHRRPSASPATAARGARAARRARLPRWGGRRDARDDRALGRQLATPRAPHSRPVCPPPDASTRRSRTRSAAAPRCRSCRLAPMASLPSVVTSRPPRRRSRGRTDSRPHAQGRPDLRDDVGRRQQRLPALRTAADAPVGTSRDRPGQDTASQEPGADSSHASVVRWARRTIRACVSSRRSR
jgi:hypothetical protein